MTMSQPLQRRAYILRPYFERIRERMVDALSRIDVAVGASDTIAAGISDDEVLSWLRARPTPTALVVPFHAHRTPDKQLVHGLDLIVRIQDELPAFQRVPIVSPISNLGLAAASLMLSRYADTERFLSVLFLHEDELEDRDLPLRIREHFHAARARAWSAA